jgi:hypothetical protein
MMQKACQATGESWLSASAGKLDHFELSLPAGLPVKFGT